MSDLIFDEKLTFCLKNDMRNLANFHASSRKFENLLVVKSFAKNDLWFQKWHKKFGEFSHK